MPVTEQREHFKDLQQHRRDTLNALIGKQVLHSLGKPGDLLTVQVRPLWENRSRANVFVGKDAASAKVAHSYFLMTDDDGNILEANPKITRKY
jgi:hypothetical protein